MYGKFSTTSASNTTNALFLLEFYRKFRSDAKYRPKAQKKIRAQKKYLDFVSSMAIAKLAHFGYLHESWSLIQMEQKNNKRKRHFTLNRSKEKQCKNHNHSSSNLSICITQSMFSHGWKKKNWNQSQNYMVYGTAVEYSIHVFDCLF